MNGKWSDSAGTRVTTENVERYSYRRPEGDVTQLGRRGSSRCEQTVIVSGHVWGESR